METFGKNGTVLIFEGFQLQMLVAGCHLTIIIIIIIIIIMELVADTVKLFLILQKGHISYFIYLLFSWCCRIQSLYQSNLIG